jgi:hypothetical protein
MKNAISLKGMFMHWLIIYLHIPSDNEYVYSIAGC